MARPFTCAFIIGTSRIKNKKPLPKFLLDKIMGKDNLSVIEMAYPQISKKTIKNACKFIYHYKVPKNLSKFSNPVMFWRGSEDPIPEKSEKVLIEYLPQMETEVFEEWVTDNFSTNIPKNTQRNLDYFWKINKENIMDITRAILDGIAMAAIFNGAVAAFVLINPRFFFDSYPKEIQNSAPEKMTKEEKRVNLILTYIIAVICLIYGVTSLLHTGIRGIRDLFWMSYIQWIILNFGDFLLLDVLLFQGKYKNRIVIPGTEGHEDYEFGNWMKHLAIKEHFILMPFLLIPIVSIIEAWLVLLLGL